MSISTIARRLQISHQVLLPFLRSFTCPPYTTPAILRLFILSFSDAFHRTFSIPSQVQVLFSTCKSFSSQHFPDTFELIEPRIHTNDPLKLGLIESLKQAACFPAEVDAMASLDDSGIKASQNLVYSGIWELREEWKVAFLAFKWGEKWGCVDEKACELIVWVLAIHKKFNIAWTLIRDMHRSSMNPKQAMLIMIDRYAAANNPGKAIGTFHTMEKFRLGPDEEAFYTLMNALCKHGNVEEAEEFMLVNKQLFPLETRGFNIILSGWCNVYVDIFEAKRVWREMSKCCITPDATSYTLMISCFSKVGNLFDSLRLYDEMKKRGWVPGVEVYNSLVYVLTHENCFDEALKIPEKMKERGLQPDSTTYNAMIQPLCRANKLKEARNILARMAEENISPTMETYHALLECADFEVMLEVLKQMRKAGLDPNGQTFCLILARFFKLEHPENALRIWAEMKQYEVVPDSTHYTLLVEGLVRCGMLAKAREYYTEMISNGFLDDPKLQKMLQEPVQDEEKRKPEPRQRQVKRNQHLVRGKSPQSKKEEKRKPEPRQRQVKRNQHPVRGKSPQSKKEDT